MPNLKSELRVRRYAPEHAKQWDDFAAAAKNSTFLFQRAYMDYHSERFTDHSILIQDGDRIVAVFPACEMDKVIQSHAGLTYGGLVMEEAIHLDQVLGCFGALANYYRRQGFEDLIYKRMPDFYSRLPAGEDEYALQLLGAPIFKRETAFVIRLDSRLPLQERRVRSGAKARKAGVVVREANDGAELAVFWNRVLTPHLQARFGSRPVHSLQEISLLKAEFAENIKLHLAFCENEIVAGAVLYLTPRVVHTQYTCTNEQGRTLGALDLLILELLESGCKSRKFLSFGTANQPDGNGLNEGLVEWKESFGARTVCHDFYRVALKNDIPAGIK